VALPGGPRWDVPVAIPFAHRGLFVWSIGIDLDLDLAALLLAAGKDL
jgi:hypothetical protein